MVTKLWAEVNPDVGRILSVIFWSYGLSRKENFDTVDKNLDEIQSPIPTGLSTTESLIK